MRCPVARTEKDLGVTGGWIEGKPVTALMRELMNDAQDGDLLLENGTPEFYASLILERWGWLRGTHPGKTAEMIIDSA